MTYLIELARGASAQSVSAWGATPAGKWKRTSDRWWQMSYLLGDTGTFVEAYKHTLVRLSEVNGTHQKQLFTLLASWLFHLARHDGELIMLSNL